MKATVPLSACACVCRHQLSPDSVRMGGGGHLINYVLKALGDEAVACLRASDVTAMKTKIHPRDTWEQFLTDKDLTGIFAAAEQPAA